ncbi:hypothetical protein COOONC_25607, partial [Cooperia oncophora]
LVADELTARRGRNRCIFDDSPSGAQTPKAKFDSKVKALGVKFYTVAEIGKLTDCIDDSFYACATMKEIKEKAISCAMENTAAAKYITLMKLLTGSEY